MTFPVSERVVYEHHTLDQVIFQIRFPTILAIGSDPPTAFQERIRGEYPLYQRVEAAALPAPIAGVVSQLPIRPAASIAHHFSTVDSGRSIALAPDSLSITETNYDEWPVLRPKIQDAKEALEETYAPAFYSRVGLRYRDVVDRDQFGVSTRSWSELLNPAFSGLLGAEEEVIRDSVSQYAVNALIDLDSVEGGLVRLQHGLAVKPGSETIAYLIDADYYTEIQQVEGAILGILDHFRAEAGNLFRWAISPVLRDALGRRQVEQGVVT